MLEEDVKPAVEAFLSQRGLSLSEEKTRIVPIERGFDFLGQNPRKYGGKLLLRKMNEEGIMAKAKCPTCGCEKFYIKDPDDEYETYAFECRDGEICFDPESAECDPPVPDADTEAFCDRCAWHDRIKALKK